jgi:hypothetical protein
MSDSDQSPPPAKKGNRGKENTRQNKQRSRDDGDNEPAAKKDEKRTQEKPTTLPKRRSYDIRLPATIVKGLLEKNNIPIEMKDLQLKILVKEKKK